MQHDTMNTNLSSSVLLKRLLRDYVLPHRSRIIFAVFCMVIAAMLTATNAWMIQPMLDKIFLEKDTTMLMLIPLAVVVISVLNSAANYGHIITMRFVGQRIIADMQIQLFRHLMHADLTMFHDQASGRLISRFTNDIQLMRATVSTVLTGIAKETLAMVFLIAVMFYQSWQLALISFVLFPIAGLPIIRMGKRMRKISDSTQSELGSFSAQLDDTFQGARVVKAYAREDFEVERATGIIDNLFRLYIKAARIQSLSGPMMEAFGGIAIAGVIAYGGSAVLTGETTPGAFFSFITAMIMAYRPAKIVAGLNNTLQEGLSAANRLFQVLDTLPHINDKYDAPALTASAAHVRFENVGFRYNTEGGGVEDITIDIPAGKTAALVGPSGGGKTTLINLLLRFYDVQQGRITINGTDIRDITLSSLRNHMALVSQDTVLFNDSIYANILYGRLDATEQEVMEAAKLAAADEFINQLPEGYATRVGPQGVKLSGGQKQRIAIARALLKNAPILLLDEATSALDNTSERLVQEALARLMQNRTTLVIAHRLSTVRNADTLHVIDKGRLVETGNHASLIEQRGLYFTLHSRHMDNLSETA